MSSVPLALQMRQGKASWLLVAYVGLVTMLGPGASDAYLPAFGALGQELGASPTTVQQTLTVYWAALAIMSLWHGTLSDAFGRRRMLLVSLGGFALATLGCALAPTIELLLVCRFIQGVFAGAGSVVGRAVVRDVFEGPAIQRQLARISMMFAIAPVIAPALGGWLLLGAGWRTIFFALLAASLVLLVVGLRSLPETLAPQQRIPLQPGAVLRVGMTVLKLPAFQVTTAVATLCQSGLFIVVAAAPAIVVGHHNLSTSQFHWLLGPMVAGLLLGSSTSSWLAGRIAANTQINSGLSILGIAALVDLGLALGGVVAVPWTFAPVFVYAFGLMMTIPVLIARLMQAVPTAAGTASSFFSFVLSGGMAAVSGLVVPLCSDSLVALAGAKAALAAAGIAVAWTSRGTRS